MKKQVGMWIDHRKAVVVARVRDAEAIVDKMTDRQIEAKVRQAFAR